MKKLLLLVVAILLFTLCACGEKNITNDLSDNSVETNEELFSGEVGESGDDGVDEYTLLLNELLNKTYQDGTIKVLNHNSKQMEDLDFNYAKEYYKIVSSDVNNEEVFPEFATIMKDGKFPILVKKDDEQISAWSYENGLATPIDANSIDVQNAFFVDKYSASQSFENTFFYIDSMYQKLSNFNSSNMSIESFHAKLKEDTDDVDYGSCYYGISHEDGSEEEIIISSDVEDGVLYISVEDTFDNKNDNRKIMVSGISDELYKGIIHSNMEADVKPEILYEITNKGDLYRINIPKEGESVTAEKIANVSNIVDFDYIDYYPFSFVPYGEEGGYEVVITSDGSVIPLDSI